MNPGEVHVWRVRLDRHRSAAAHARRDRRAPRASASRRTRSNTCARTPRCAPSWQLHRRAPRFRGRGSRQAVSARRAAAQFNLSHSRRDGAGRRWRSTSRSASTSSSIRPLPDYAAIAERFFPPRKPPDVHRRARFLPPLDALRSRAQGARRRDSTARARNRPASGRSRRSMPGPSIRAAVALPRARYAK